MTRPFLIVDHPYGEREESYFVPMLRACLATKGVDSVVTNISVLGRTNFQDASTIDSAQYAATIFASGYGKIRGNEALKPEMDLMQRLEDEGKPVLYETHGAQIRVVMASGPDAIEKLDEKRDSIVDCWKYLASNGLADPIFQGFRDLGTIEDGIPTCGIELFAKEYRSYGIAKVPDEYEVILTCNREPVMARHKDPEKIAYIMQLQPEFIPNSSEDIQGDELLSIQANSRIPNAVRLLHNFLRIVEDRS